MSRNGYLHFVPHVPVCMIKQPSSLSLLPLIPPNTVDSAYKPWQTRTYSENWCWASACHKAGGLESNGSHDRLESSTQTKINQSVSLKSSVFSSKRKLFDLLGTDTWVHFSYFLQYSSSSNNTFRSVQKRGRLLDCCESMSSISIHSNRIHILMYQDVDPLGISNWGLAFHEAVSFGAAIKLLQGYVNFSFHQSLCKISMVKASPCANLFLTHTEQVPWVSPEPSWSKALGGVSSHPRNFNWAL